MKQQNEKPKKGEIEWEKVINIVTGAITFDRTLYKSPKESATAFAKILEKVKTNNKTLATAFNAIARSGKFTLDELFIH